MGSTWDWNDDDEPVQPKKRKKSKNYESSPPSGESMKSKIDYKLDLHAPVMEAQGNATIPVAWCFKPDSPLRALFEAEQWQNPHILLIVSSLVSSTVDARGRTKEKWQDTAIYSAKVTEALKYLSFRRPGRNRVRAVLVDVVNRKAKGRLTDLTHTKRFASDDFSFSDPDVAEYSSIGLGDFDKKIYDESAEFFVNVPEEMFAAPPTGFKKAVIEFWWGSKALEDACDSRKKAWVIGTPLWVVTLPLVYALKAFLVAVLLVMGSRGLKEGVLWRTLVNPMKGIFATMEAPHDTTSVYIRPKDVDGRQQDPWFNREDKKFFLGFTIFLNPLIWFGPATIAYVISRIKYHHVIGKGESKHEVYTRVADWSYWDAVWKVDRIILGALVLLAGLLAVTILVGFLVTKFQSKTSVRSLRRRVVQWFAKPAPSEDEVAKQRRLMLDQLALLACGPEGAPLTVGQLPKELRTLSLRYNELKTKVCKPFAS